MTQRNYQGRREGGFGDDDRYGQNWDRQQGSSGSGTRSDAGSNYGDWSREGRGGPQSGNQYEQGSGRSGQQFGDSLSSGSRNQEARNFGGSQQGGSYGGGSYGGQGGGR